MPWVSPLRSLISKALVHPQSPVSSKITYSYSVAYPLTAPCKSRLNHKKTATAINSKITARTNMYITELS